jgi:tetratricopeptide (TPR) repeat protein
LIKLTINIFLLLTTYSFAEDTEIQKTFQEKNQSILVTADHLYSEREDFNKAKKALQIFEQYNKDYPNSVEGLWRLSMGHYYIGHLLLGKKNRFNRKDHFRKGLEAGKKCESLSKKPKVECYFWQATNLALLEQEKGIMSLAFSLGDIIDLLEKAKKTDATYASAGAYRTLAILYSKAPGFLGGDNEKARSYIKKAIELAPNEPLNIVFYAKFLINDDNKPKAIKTISSFIKRADPLKFPFFESKNAYKELNHFLKHEQWPE